jgi:glycosyltransferase involved in cell wall biosynthesis
MKKIVILAYDFPPYNSVGGQRPYAWYIYLKQFGYEPIVVTRHWDMPINNSRDYILPSIKQKLTKEITKYGIIYSTPFNPNLRDRLIIKYGLDKHAFIRKTLTIWYMFTEFITFKFDNKKSLFEAANIAIRETKPEIIISTGEPFILFRYASLLSKKHNIPWVADYRDGWSTNYTRSYWERKYYAFFEKKLLTTASAVTAASLEFAKHIQDVINKPVKTLVNGYFEEKFESIIPPSKQDKFIISFAGTLYPYQPIEIIAQGFKNLNQKQKNKILFRFIGVRFYPEQMYRILQAFKDCNAEIEFTDRLSHKDALDLLNKSSLLLLPANKHYPQIYAKIFDYLALKKNILLCKSDEGSLKEIIQTTQAGFICNSSQEVTNTIEKLFATWEQSGAIECNSVNIETYTRKNQTKKLTDILNKVTNK